MDPTVPTIHSVLPPDTNNSFFSPTPFYKRRFFIIIMILCAFIIIGFLFYFLVIKNNNSSRSTQESSKMWEIILTKNTAGGKLAVKTIAIKNGVAQASPFKASPYKLYVYDKNNTELFKTDIFITEMYVNSIYIPPGSSNIPEDSLSQPENVESIITVPYFKDAYVITIKHDGSEVLKILPPKLTVSLEVPRAYAESTCTPLTIVFIGDGYSDMEKFRQQTAIAKNILLTTDPYSSKPGIFDFKIVENPASNNLGCYSSGSYNPNCVSNSITISKARTAVYNAYPSLSTNSDYTKIAILVDANIAANGTLGNIDMPAGALSTFQTKSELANTFLHEFGGHGIGKLMDRYVAYSASNFPSIFRKSNCSPSQNGEQFWKTAGASGGGYPACLATNFFAPEPNDCGNAGNSHTVMSAGGGCSGPYFDTVEKYWINTQILPLYNECEGAGSGSDNIPPTNTPTPKLGATNTPTPTLPPGTTATPTPTPTTAPGGVSTPTPTRSVFIPPGTPTPTPAQYFTCVPDPKCANSGNTLQICPLVCTSK